MQKLWSEILEQNTPCFSFPTLQAVCSDLLSNTTIRHSWFFKENLARWTTLYLVAKQTKSKKYRNNVKNVILPSPFQLLPKARRWLSTAKKPLAVQKRTAFLDTEDTWAQKASHHFVREGTWGFPLPCGRPFWGFVYLTAKEVLLCYSAFLFPTCHTIPLQHLLPNVTN